MSQHGFKPSKKIYYGWWETKSKSEQTLGGRRECSNRINVEVKVCFVHFVTALNRTEKRAPHQRAIISERSA